MIVTRSSVARQNETSPEEVWQQELSDPSSFAKILKDMEFARRFAAKTLEEMYVLQT